MHGFGIAGAGIIAAAHAQAIAGLANAELVAVTDTGAGTARRFASEYGGEAAYDLDALLARDDIDVVSVCVPSGLHAMVGVRAAAAGKHLVVEKPIDVTLAAADRLIEAAGAVGGTAHRHLAAPVRSGPDRVEEPWSAAARLAGCCSARRARNGIRSQAYYDSAAWRGTSALDGGSLMNQGIHYVDLLLWAMGPVAEVTALTATQTHQMEAEDVALALLKFRSGALGTIVTSTSVYPGFAQRLEVTGTSGTIVVTDGEITKRGLSTEAAPTSAAASAGSSAPSAGSSAPVAGASSPLVGAASHAAQLEAFLRAVDSQTEPSPAAADARAALEVVLAVYESARTGQPVRLPLPSDPGAVPP